MKFIKFTHLTLFILITVFFCFKESSAQTPDWAWATTINGYYDEYVRALATDNNGNVIVAGQFTSDSISIRDTILKNTGGSEIFIAKYNTSGNLLWARSVEGIYNDEVTDIAIDTNNNILLVGLFQSPKISFEAVSLNRSIELRNIFMAKYDTHGNVLWAKSENATGVRAIRVEKSGNFFIAGSFINSSITLGTTVLYNTATSSDDIYLAKYNPSGNLIWAKAAGGKSEETLTAIDIDSEGNIYLTGSFSSVDFQLGSHTLTSKGQYDIFVTEYDKYGDVVWAKSISGIDYEISEGITVDKDKNIYVTGSFQGSLTVASETLTSAEDDMFLIKFDSNGNEVWAKTGNGAEDETGLGIDSDASGNIYVTGSFTSLTSSFNSIFLKNSGAPYPTKEIFVIKYDQAGYAMWAKAAGGIADEYGYRICVDPDENIFIAGSHSIKPVKFGTFTVEDNGNSNTFIAKLQSISTNVDAEIENYDFQLLYPNPSTGLFHFSGLAPGQWQLRVFNTLGQCIHSSEITGPQAQIDLTSQPKGTYIYQLQNREETLRQGKIVLE